jgi:hypothetical protein
MSWKVVYNKSFGGFKLSDIAVELLIQRGLPRDPYCTKIPRHHPELVAIVEILGEKANGDFSQLNVTEVTGKYIIDEYDGQETIKEEHEIPFIDPVNVSISLSPHEQEELEVFNALKD